MKCPYCSYLDSKVIDSRPAEEGVKVRRRRECLECTKRFTTYEIVETAPIMVIKKDKSREPFDADKLLRGFIRACEKRKVPIEVLESAVTDIQGELLNTMEREIPSTTIGVLAMKHLQEIDEVAYIRFASVYREFQDMHSFLKELEDLAEKKTKA